MPNSRNALGSKVAAILSGLCAILVLQLFWIKLNSQGFFIDEVRNVQTAWNFFLHGQFTVDMLAPLHGAFQPDGSTGIASNWPGGLGWLISGTIEGARILNLIFVLGLAIWICLLLWKAFFSPKQQQSLGVSIPAFWYASVGLLFFSFPPGTTDTALLSLGETSGFLILVAGAFYLRKVPALGAFILGICVWHTKQVYLPFAGALLAAPLLHSDIKAYRLSSRVRDAFSQGGFFLLPLLIWLGLIWIQTGWQGLSTWTHGRINFLTSLSTLQHLPPMTLLERLRSPLLEWVSFGAFQKLKILALLLVPAIDLGILAVKDQRRRLSWALASACFIYFLHWYFHSHPTMWLRHILPALLCGGAWLLYRLFYWLSKLPNQRLQNGILIFGICVLVLHLFESRHWILAKPGALSNSAYLLNCRADHPLATGPMDVPECMK